MSELFSDLDADPLPRMQADVFAEKRFRNEGEAALENLYIHPIPNSSGFSKPIIHGAEQVGRKPSNNIDYSFMQRLLEHHKF